MILPICDIITKNIEYNAPFYGDIMRWRRCALRRRLIIGTRALSSASCRCYTSKEKVSRIYALAGILYCPFLAAHTLIATAQLLRILFDAAFLDCSD